MKRIFNVSLLLVICGFMITGCATSAKRKPISRAQRANEIFASLDRNHDGSLTRDELRQGLRIAGAPDVNPNLMMGLKSDKAKQGAKASRPLTDAEIEKAVEDAFSAREAKDAKLDQRLSQDEFRKLVVERPPNEEEDPWAPFMANN